MHLLARFPHQELATLTKTIDFVHADIFPPLLVTLEKTATIKVSSEKLSSKELILDKEQLAFLLVVVLFLVTNQS